MDVKSNLIIVIILVSAVGVKGVHVEENFTFGGCEPGKETCRECYLTLAKSLLGNGTNVLNLMTTFFPPDSNPPDSVIVIYHFRNQSIYINDAQRKWFWGTTFGYFLHPLTYFQFLSLLFGKPEPLYEKTVAVTLDAGCIGVKDNFMQVLTQRLKAYVQDQSITARFDESHAASAVNDATFNETIKRYGQQESMETEYLAVTFSLVYPVIIPISMLVIIVLLITLFVCVRKHRHTGENQHTRFQKLTRRVRAGIISFVIISFARLVMIVGMDAAAVFYSEDTTETEEIHHEKDRQHQILYNLPHVLLAYDSLFSATYIVIVIVATVSHFRAKPDQDKQLTSDRTYYILALTVVCPILSFFIHLPFIAIAYLNDANYAGSVFIFYAIVILLEFLILEFTFISCFRLPKSSQLVPETASRNKKLCFDRLNFANPLFMALVVVLCLFFLYLLLGISVCFFYYLPIVHSLSRSSNQIIVIYQTCLIIVGAVVMYKTVFRRTNPLIKALKRKEVMNIVSKSGMEEWEANTDREKLADFYSFMITDVIRNLSMGRIPKKEDTDGQKETKFETPAVKPTTTLGTSGYDNPIELTLID